MVWLLLVVAFLQALTNYCQRRINKSQISINASQIKINQSNADAIEALKKRLDFRG